MINMLLKHGAFVKTSYRGLFYENNSFRGFIFFLIAYIIDSVIKLTKGFCFLTFLNQVSLSALSKEYIELIEKHPQKFEQILTEMNYKSKKKRIRKKILKLAVIELFEFSKSENTNKVNTNNFKTENPNVKDVTESFDVNKLPISFVLKVGKRFFENEQVFRFYYNQNHPEFYKNKELLLKQFKNLIKESDGKLQSEIHPLIKEQLSS